MTHKYVVTVILVLLFGITLVVFADPILEKIDATDTMLVRDKGVITKWSNATNGG